MFFIIHYPNTFDANFELTFSYFKDDFAKILKRNFRMIIAPAFNMTKNSFIINNAKKKQSKHHFNLEENQLSKFEWFQNMTIKTYVEIV